jgi:predicted metal-binding membrane protein
VMMIAMMFPTAAPMILTFARVHQTRRQRGAAFVPTWVFVAGYLLVWAVAGVGAYALAVGVESLTNTGAWMKDYAAVFSGALFIIAGAYQLTPLKNVCLSRCQTPLSFILHSWREGYGGAFRMGVEHGGYCFGCCWLLFVILFPLGVMNIAAMALITFLILAEKSLPFGKRVAQFAALALILFGIYQIFIAPQLMPISM